ncbi:hypothetical protein DYB26_006586 [Aphanomyces astaci]|uniref:MARVEL domain-containing protein n=1 Tax=Aphanomyces astaci TaxID=112090 RepID=A0A397DFV4_APHAT|nr:hypothetical protein DYB34_004178 [Aphanomyces astaci]RHY63698.1 hypothetical protein DYB38_007414 [Aphanomyces astaci]RHY84416.1 hypothetical protein DYB26_006586 [Aphanomyces astaci]
MSRVQSAKIAQISMLLRVLQGVSGAIILISLLSTYRPVVLSDIANNVDSKEYIAVNLSHFFLAIAASLSIAYGVIQVVFEVILSRIKTDALLERCADAFLASLFVVVACATAPSMACSPSKYQKCTNFQVAVVFAFLSAVLFVVSIAFNAQVKSIRRGNPDATENLVPRGRFGGESAVLESRHPKKPKKKAAPDQSEDLDEVDPRGHFGSVRCADFTAVNPSHDEYADEDVYFNSSHRDILVKPTKGSV